MNRVVPSLLLLAVATTLSAGAGAQGTDSSAAPSQNEKAIQKQQTNLYKYQKSQEKAQAKAQRKSDKQQRKAAKNYEKQQRKLLKASSHPAKPTS